MLFPEADAAVEGMEVDRLQHYWPAKLALNARQWVTENDLTLHPTKTKIVDSRVEGFAFLGYQFLGETRAPRDKSLLKVRETIRRYTKRTSGDSLAYIVVKLNETLRGWMGYFQHC